MKLRTKRHTTLQQTGFTLVEMLSVIAIIGILASVTFAGLSGARRNARDKSIMSEMQGLLVEAALYQARNGGSYSGLCGTASVTTLTSKIDTDNGSYAAPTCQVAAGNASYGIVVRLNAGTYYCVDSTKYYGADADGALNAATRLCS